MKGHPDALKLMYARAALLVALGELIPQSVFLEATASGGVCGGAAVEWALRHYEMICTGRYPRIAISASDSRQLERDRRLGVNPAATRRGLAVRAAQRREDRSRRA